LGFNFSDPIGGAADAEAKQDKENDAAGGVFHHLVCRMQP
jgi:hypothetical protein